MGQDYSKPQRGDLIEIKRTSHQHWALYMGDGYVIHLKPVGKPKINLRPHEVSVFTRMVEMQRLKKVVRHRKWRVNNKYDESRDPLPVEEIISRALAYVGKKVKYRSFGRNCEDFVEKLRYGETVSELLRAFVDGELHIPDMRDDKVYPVPGDLIEIDRPLYQHWALYVGNGYVIHVTPIGDNSPPATAGSVTLFIKRAKVKKELLKDAAGEDKWRVNNKYDHYCKPFPVEEILRRAESEIGKVVQYRLLHKNCEHFVTDLRYGEGVSEQAMTAREKIRATVGTVMAGVGQVSVSVLAAVLFPFGIPILFAYSIANGLALSNILANNDFILEQIMKAKIHILQKRCC